MTALKFSFIHVRHALTAPPWTSLGREFRVREKSTHIRECGRQFIHLSSQNMANIYAIIELDEGPKIPSNIVGCEPEDVYVDMEVTAIFENVSDNYTLTKFKPA